MERAQKRLDRQLRISWTSLLNRIANQANPARKTIFGQHALDLDYYWSVEESERASDILFRSAADLPKTHRYMLTKRGQSAIAALLAARHANIEKLAQPAA